MRKLFTAALVILFGAVLLLGISGTMKIAGYGDGLIPGKPAEAYINKSVGGNTGEIIYKETKDAETGSANMVTSVIVNYRSFDTLGEVTVLFLAAVGVSLLIGGGGKEKKRKKSGFILRTSASVIFPIMLITGIYIFTHGHLTPGGGFPGGSMIASSFLLLYMADEKFALKLKGFKLAEGIAGSLYVLIGAAGLLIGGYFLSNIFPTGTVGNLFSAGIIPIIYVIIGLKVGSEITGIVSDMLKEEVSV